MKNDSGITVTGDKVLIRPFKVEGQVGSIIIPEMVQKKEQMAQQMGTLVAVADDIREHPNYGGELEGIELGDSVLFPRYQFSQGQFTFDENEYWIMRCNSILGKSDKIPDYMIRGAESSLSVFGMNDAVA